jgi:hypothetical protein
MMRTRQIWIQVWPGQRPEFIPAQGDRPGIIAAKKTFLALKARFISLGCYGVGPQPESEPAKIEVLGVKCGWNIQTPAAGGKPALRLGVTPV